MTTTATAVKERPILFSAPMVRAILDGKKTQTRRIIKPQPPPYIDALHGYELRKRAPYTLEDNETGCILGSGFEDDNCVLYRCRYGQPGDRLWVRETWLELRSNHYHESGPKDKLITAQGRPVRNGVEYRANIAEEHAEESEQHRKELGYLWKPSIHMPRWASRITLEVESVRVERLHEITEEDAIAEGVKKVRDACYVIPGYGYDNSGLCHTSPITPFESLWRQLNGDESWDSNPWLWVISFKKLAG